MGSTPLTDYYLDRLTREQQGAVVVTVHMSNFDLAGLAFAYRGLYLNVLAYANPTSGYDLQNKIRLKGGINLMPIDVSALRKSLEALRAGQLVVTGIDRPDPYGGGDVALLWPAGPVAGGPCAAGLADRLPGGGGALNTDPPTAATPYTSRAGDGAGRQPQETILHNAPGGRGGADRARRSSG